MKTAKPVKKKATKSDDDRARGEFLRDFRTRILKRDQKSLAKALKVKQNTVSAWETGTNHLPSEVLIEVGNLAGWPDCKDAWKAAGVNIQATQIFSPALLGEERVTVPLIESYSSRTASSLQADEDRPSVLRTGRIKLSDPLVPDDKTTLCIRVASQLSCFPFKNGDLVGVDSSSVAQLGFRGFLGSLVAVRYSAVPAYIAAPVGHDGWLKWSGIHVGWLRVEQAPPPSALWRLTLEGASVAEAGRAHPFALTDWQQAPFSVTNDGQIEKALEDHAADNGLEASHKIFGRVIWWISGLEKSQTDSSRKAAKPFQAVKDGKENKRSR